MPLRMNHDEGGFAMVTVIVVMFAATMLSIAALSAAQGDLKPGNHDKRRKVAYAAAEAGVQNYVFHLVQDTNYWAKCTTVGGAVNDPWNGTAPAADPRTWQSVPNSQEAYTIELLPAGSNASRPTRCSTASPDDSMIDSSTGTFRIRATGRDRPGGVKRSIVVNFKRKSLLDFIYYTDKETRDPSLYAIDSGGYPTDDQAGSGARDVSQWGAQQCDRYWGDDSVQGSRGAQLFSGSGGSSQTGIKIGSDWQPWATRCTEIQFAGGDVVRGPFHTNDEILCNGSPKFGRTPVDQIEMSSKGQTGPSTGYRGCTPYVNAAPPAIQTKSDAGTLSPGVDPVDPPPSNSSLKRDTDPAYRFVGQTLIVMNGTSMVVFGTREDGTVLSGTSVPLPADGLVYVANSPTAGCTPYNPIDTAAIQLGCGNLWVQGSYGVNLTLTAENDIVVTDDVTRASGTEALLGLISNNFIRVYHPVKSLSFTYDSSSDSVDSNCTNNGGPGSIQIDAAILSLAHSFIVDNYHCGSPLGTLTVNGAIAQRFRGTVGTGGSSINTGYLKNYTYDDRLRYRSPPHFLDPVKAAWGVQTETEQVPAR